MQYDSVKKTLHQRFANGTQVIEGKEAKLLCSKSKARAFLSRGPLSRGLGFFFSSPKQGRLLQWHPGAYESKRKALPDYCPDLLARFCKEASLSKSEMLPDIGKPFSYIVNDIPTSRP